MSAIGKALAEQGVDDAVASSPRLRQLVVDAAHVLNVTLRAPVDDGVHSLQLQGIDIAVGADIELDTLVLVADLGTTILGTAAQRQIALEAVTELMLLTGVTLGRNHLGVQLISRWAATDQTAQDLSDWLSDFAALAVAIIERDQAHAPDASAATAQARRSAAGSAGLQSKGNRA